MDVSDATRLKVLEDENAKPKKLLTALVLDVPTLRDLLAKIADARLAARCLDLGNGAEGTTQGRACGLISTESKTFRYASRRPDDART